MRKIGIHLSIAGGIYNALKKAQDLKVNAVQIFLKNSNRWEGTPYKTEDIKKFFEIRSLSDIQIFAHSGYLINPAGDGEVLKKSIIALKDEINRAEVLGIEYLVIHPGNHKGIGEPAAIKRIAESIDTALYNNPHITILLETTAGQGTSIGYKFEHLKEIIKSSHYPEQLGICLDTCHIFTAGYNISTEISYNEVMLQFDSIIGFENLKLIHLNDSKKECGSNIDRHEHIGKGFIGKKGFKLLLNDQRLIKIPLVLETPKFDDDKADRMNLKTVRNIINKS